MKCQYCGIEGCRGGCTNRQIGAFKSAGLDKDGIAEVIRLTRSEAMVEELVRLFASEQYIISFARENDRYLARIGRTLEVRGNTPIELLANIKRALL